MKLLEQNYFVKNFMNHIKTLPPEIIMNTFINYNTPIWSLGVIINWIFTNKYLSINNNIKLLKIKKEIENKNF